ncbi:MAG: tetratricopeptide repeat protein [Pirellulales bacterium]
MPAPEPHSSNQQASKPSLRARLAGLVRIPARLGSWIVSHRLLAVLGLAVSGVLGVAITAVYLTAHSKNDPAENLAQLETALEALAQGRYAEARELAEPLCAPDKLPPEDMGKPLFILGAVAARDAEEMANTESAKLYRRAADALDEAFNRGFPQGCEAEGLFLLGKSLCLGGRLADGRTVLETALKTDRQRETEIHRLLAGAYLTESNPNLRLALTHNTRYLTDPKLATSARHQGLLQRSQILERQGDLAGSRAALNQIPPTAANSAEVLVMRGRLLLREAGTLKTDPALVKNGTGRAEALKKYRAAIEALRQSQRRDTLGSRSTRKSMYLLGIAQAGIEDSREALAEFGQVHLRYPGTPESTAARLREADLLRQLGRHAEAVAAYCQAVAEAGDPATFRNPWFTLDEFRASVLTAYRYYLQAQRFREAVELAEHLEPLFARDMSIQLAADAQQAWGRALLAQAEQLPEKKAEIESRAARTHLRVAGILYRRLAALRYATREYPDLLWQSASDSLEGRDYASAAKVLREYLTSEVRSRQPQALANLGEALLAGNKLDEALTAFADCIREYPRDAASYRARLLASTAYLAKNDTAQAEVLLRANLDGESLTPASKEWRESLFALGRLLYAAGRYEEAVAKLEEAVARYPGSADAVEGRYLIAQSCQRRAEAQRERLASDAIPAARQARQQQIRQFLEAALSQYDKLLEEIAARGEKKELSSLDRAIRRNGYFARAATLAGLEQYEEAIRAYATVIRRYEGAPEVLDAYAQMAECYRRLNKPREAQGALAQARLVLNRLKPEAPFRETTTYTRQEWASLFDWLGAL